MESTQSGFNENLPISLICRSADVFFFVLMIDGFTRLKLTEGQKGYDSVRVLLLILEPLVTTSRLRMFFVLHSPSIYTTL